MSLLVKTIRGRRYLYQARRDGKRVVHRYLGPVGSARAREALEDETEFRRVPPRLQTLFWDARLSDIHPRRNASYIIERILELGGLDAVRWLRLAYPTRLIRSVSRDSRRLTEKSRNFWSLWLARAA